MSQQAYKRLAKEYKQIKKNPPPFIEARPSESNILDWHYVITGPPGTPYEGGQYHGRVTFPPEYPFKPPRIKMCTPSGRFEVNQRICLSMSDFHEELWNPSWSVATIINGLLSFMTSDERTTGSIVTPESTKRELARRSKYYNMHSNPMFRENFPELAEKNRQEEAEAEAKAKEKLKEKLKAKAKAKENSKEEVSVGASTATASTAPKPKPIEDAAEITDAEDRIRAVQLKEAAELARLQGEGGSGSLYTVAAVLLAVVMGLVLKLSSNA